MYRSDLRESSPHSNYSFWNPIAIMAIVTSVMDYAGWGDCERDAILLTIGYDG